MFSSPVGDAFHEEMRPVLVVAIAEVEQAIPIYRMLVPTQPTIFRPHLGRALVNLAGIQLAMGRQQKAHQLLLEGIDVWRKAAEQDPALTPFLAQAHAGLSQLFSEMSDYAQAATAAGDTVLAWRAASTYDPALLADLAESLLVHSSLLSAIGRKEPALGAAQEALSTAQQATDEGLLEETSSLAFRALFAFAERLETLDRCADALMAIRKAISVHSVRTDVSGTDRERTLAALHGTEARLLGCLGEHAEAKRAADTAVADFRALVGYGAEADKVNLAKALINLGLAAMRLDESPTALIASQEAVMILTRCAEEGSRCGSELALALGAYVDVRGVVQVTLDDLHDAVRALLVLVSLRRELGAHDKFGMATQARATRQHAQEFLGALSADPEYRVVRESPEAIELVQLLADLHE